MLAFQAKAAKKIAEQKCASVRTFGEKVIAVKARTKGTNLSENNRQKPEPRQWQHEQTQHEKQNHNNNANCVRH